MKHFGLRVLVITVGMIVGLAVGGLVVPAAASQPQPTSSVTFAAASPNTALNCLNTLSAPPCYAAGYFDDGSAWGGGYVQTEVVNLSGVNGAYLNEELWVGGISDNIDNWVEIGYSSDNPPCGSGSFQWFWDPVINGTQGTTYCLGSPTVGTWHQLEVQEVAAGSWGVYLDGNNVGTASMPSGWAFDAQTGLEYHDAQYTSFSGDAYYSYNEVRTTSCCTWDYWPSGTERIDYPSTYNWVWTETNPWIHGYNYQG